jgi:hypothetical protein
MEVRMKKENDGTRRSRIRVRREEVGGRLMI